MGWSLRSQPSNQDTEHRPFGQQRRGFHKSVLHGSGLQPITSQLDVRTSPHTTGCYLNSQNWRPGIAEDKLLNSHFAAAVIASTALARSITARTTAAVTGTTISPAVVKQRSTQRPNEGVDGIKFYPLPIATKRRLTTRLWTMASSG